MLKNRTVEPFFNLGIITPIMLSARHLSFLRKAILFGFVVFILVSVFSCGMFQALGNHGGADVIECDTVASVIGTVSIRDFALYAALVAIVVSLSLVLSGTTYRKMLVPVLSVTTVRRFLEHQRGFFNFLVEAFRRGLIHGQVYNSASG